MTSSLSPSRWDELHRRSQGRTECFLPNPYFWSNIWKHRFSNQSGKQSFVLLLKSPLTLRLNKILFFDPLYSDLGGICRRSNRWATTDDPACKGLNFKKRWRADQEMRKTEKKFPFPQSAKSGHLFGSLKSFWIHCKKSNTNVKKQDAADRAYPESLPFSVSHFLFGYFLRSLKTRTPALLNRHLSFLPPSYNSAHAAPKLPPFHR